MDNASNKQIKMKIFVSNPFIMFLKISPAIVVIPISKVIFVRSTIDSLNLISLYNTAKCNNVTNTTLALIAIATPMMPIVALEARRNNTMNLKVEPIKLFHIACFAKSSPYRAD